MPGFPSFWFGSRSCTFLHLCLCIPGVCRSGGPPGPVRLGPGGRFERGPHTEEDSSHDPAVEDHEQQTIWSLLPEQLRMLHRTLQVTELTATVAIFLWNSPNNWSFTCENALMLNTARHTLMFSLLITTL